MNLYRIIRLLGRSRKGAWIEIGKPEYKNKKDARRSRKGAWIEISVRAEFGNDPRSRSRKGAWIEICTQRIAQSLALVAPARERGLKFSLIVLVYIVPYRRSRKGAWIEIEQSQLK